MKHRWIVACALGLLASPVALMAQQQRGNQAGQGEMPPLAEVVQAVSMGLAMLDEGNVQFLLARGDELKLTADQHTKIRALAVGWLRATRASRDTLRASLKMDPQRMRAMEQQDMRGRIQQLIPHGLLLVQEDRKALAETFRLLDPAQQEKAKAILDGRLNAIIRARSGG